MYICLCNGITDKQLESAYKSRKGNMKETFKALGLGSDCGACLEKAFQEVQQRVPKHMIESREKPRIKK